MEGGERMRKLIITQEYVRPKFYPETEYCFWIKEAVFEDDVLKLLIAAEAMEEFIGEEQLFIEEIPLNSEVFEEILGYMYSDEPTDIIELNEFDFIFFSWRGYFICVDGKMEIDWSNIEVCDKPISELSVLFEQCEGHKTEELMRRLVENA